MSTYAPRIDIHEHSAGWSITAELPGIEQDNISLHADQDRLTIRGQSSRGESSRSESSEANGDFSPLYKEWQSGDFERTIRLGKAADIKNITATHEHGVLTVAIPKAEQFTPRSIPIQG